jgi:hypothetical protein
VHRRLIFLASLLLATCSHLALTSFCCAQRRPEPAPREIDRTPPREHHGGARVELGAMLGPHLAMGGGSLAARLRPSRWFALDIGLGYYDGVGTHGSERWEVQASVSGRFFVNPDDDWHLYVLGGVGAAYGEGDTKWMFPPGTTFIDWTMESVLYLGGQLGAGVEWPIARHLSLDAELRGFVRTRMDDQQGWAPDYRDAATGANANTSGGVYVACGATVHW